MPRPLLIRSDVHPYHVISRTNGHEFFPLPLDEVWKLMIDKLFFLQKNYGLCVHGFILMGNHFHLLCHTPQKNLDQIMQIFLRTLSQKMLRNKTQDSLWEGRYKWSLIQSQTHYYQVYRYIFQNPIRAKICQKVEDYPYSTLFPTPLAIHSFVTMSFGGEEGERLWLNEIYNEEEEALIKLGLKKHQFDVGQRRVKFFNKLSAPKGL